MTPQIFVVDDDADLREAILDTFEKHRLPAKGFARASDVLEELDPDWPGVILTDIRMPGMTGLELLEEVRLNAPNVPIILFTGHADIPAAVQAMKTGAFEFLEKPVNPDHLHQVILRALKMRSLQFEVDQLQKQISSGTALNDRVIGRSKAIRFVRSDIESVAPLKVDVLVWGEGGTGKTLVSRAIHDLSPRSTEEFVTLNCSTLSAENMERVLFEPGGALDQASGGTLFLQGLETLSDQLQAQLLQIFSSADAPRVIASVGRDPNALLNEGALRADLLYRINVATIELPPLRERGRDVFHLLDYFIRSAATLHNKPHRSLPVPDLDAFGKYRWPGNVRELRNIAEKLVIGLAVRIGEEQEPDDIAETYEEAMTRFERELLTNALVQCGGRKGEAADLLGIPRKRLYLRMKHCGLDEQ
jgi:two-component system, NtrC family, phosphoglycerate transport system response regulator PgtA